MSGLEIAGVLLGTFPLIISSLEHWRDVAEMGGIFWKIRKEYSKCREDVQYYEILFKRNLKELLLPLISDPDQVADLVADPGGTEWHNEDLKSRLQERLQESHLVYIGIIREMNKTAGELRNELAFDSTAIQGHLASPSAMKPSRAPGPPPKKISRLRSAKSKFDYEAFRLKFSLNEPVRKKLLNRLDDYNQRLEKLLTTSDKTTAMQNAATPSHKKQCSTLEKAFKKAWIKSDLLFKALQNAWQCSCQQYHFAHLLLEHRTLPEIYFKIILAFIAPSSEANTPWTWREMRCGRGHGCSSPLKAVAGPTAPQSPSTPPVKANNITIAGGPPSKTGPARTPATIPKIRFELPIEPSIELCHLLSGKENANCLGVIGCDDETYHLHPLTKRKQPDKSNSITLDLILSKDFESPLTRRQRYNIALLLASSVAQLQFTPWLNTGLKKEDIFFFLCEDDDCSIRYREPFIRQGFLPSASPITDTEASKTNFYSLGILLLELCFGRRLEDYPFRQKLPAEVGEAKNGLNLMAALTWLRSVADEGGDEYDSAVKWCFTGANKGRSLWQGEIIKNVVRPLECCQQHFELAN